MAIVLISMKERLPSHLIRQTYIVYYTPVTVAVGPQQIRQEQLAKMASVRIVALAGCIQPSVGIKLD